MNKNLKNRFKVYKKKKVKLSIKKIIYLSKNLYKSKTWKNKLIFYSKIQINQIIKFNIYKRIISKKLQNNLNCKNRKTFK